MASKDDLRQRLLTTYEDLLPELDLSEGSPERDIFIEAPLDGAILSLAENNEYNAKLSAIYKYQSELSDTDIEEFCSNYNVFRNAPTYSSGIVIFYTYQAPSADVNIPLGTVTFTPGAVKYRFKTSNSVYILLENINEYYNSLSGRWEFPVAVEAVESGQNYVAGSGTVTQFEGTLLGIQGCINSIAITGGDDAETNEEMLNRVSAKQLSKGLHNDVGIQGYVENYSECYIASADDPLMKRDNGLGGCIDVYVRHTTYETFSESVVISGMELVKVGGKYSESKFYLDKCPVKTITSIVHNGIILSVSEYTLNVDSTSLLSNSTKSKDFIEFNNIKLSEGDTLLVYGTYNAFLHTLSDELNNVNNKFSLRDVLVREMLPCEITIAAQVQPISTVTVDKQLKSIDASVTAVWASALQNYINSLQHGCTITVSDIVRELNSLSTVQNINLDSCVITDISGRASIGDKYIYFNKNVYPILSQTMFTLWDN